MFVVEEILVVCGEPHHLVVVGSHYTLTKCTATQTVLSIAIHILHWSLFESDLFFRPTHKTHTHTHTPAEGMVILTDQRGPRATLWTSWEKDIAQLIPAVGYSSCVLVGHDWGGAVAWCVRVLLCVCVCEKEREGES